VEEMMNYQNTVFVEESITLNGVLRFSSLNENFEQLRPFLDKYDSLINNDKIGEFDDAIHNLGLELEFENDSAYRYNMLLESVKNPYVVDSPFLEEHNLFPFQNVGLNVIWGSLQQPNPRVLVQWDTGAGKTLCSCLTAQKLFTENKVDMVLVFCKRGPKRIDWKNEFERMTHLSVDAIGDWTRKKRHDFYKNFDSQVLILNYEKVRNATMKSNGRGKPKTADWSRTDLQQIMEMIEGKRVLIVIDEAQKINTDTNLLSSGFSTLLNREETTMCLGLTATPYKTSPLNIRNIFNVLVPDLNGISDMTPDEFKYEYGKEFGFFKTRWVEHVYVKEWNQAKLPILGKRHEKWTHIAMKSDPDISKQFPESMAKKIPFELSGPELDIYDRAEEIVKNSYNPSMGGAAWGMVDFLRVLCNTPEAMYNSNSFIAKILVDEFGNSYKTEESSKYQLIEASIDTLIEADEKVVLFTYWTHNTLFPYLKALRTKYNGNLPIYAIWGVGMSDDEQQDAIKAFNEHKGAAILLSSDAGQEGLNLYAPYLWHIEMPRSYTEYKQRKDRINRGDSVSKGITHTWIYRPVAIGTIEERTDQKVLLRRNEAEAIRGVVDENVSLEEEITVESLLFG
jgi:Type III restriction enzyme, res subunit/Helicase conserved C-terminal domain